MNRISAKRIIPVTSPAIDNGYIIVDDNGVITEIGKLPEGETPTYDGAIVPGFVNSHCHIELSHLKGLFDEATGMDGFIQQINAKRSFVDAEGRISAIEREMDNLYRQGVSAMADISNCDESFAIKAKSPIYTRTFLELFGTEPEDVQEIMDGAFALQKKASEFGLDVAPTPHSCYTMSMELNRTSAAEGLKSGYISYHNQESNEENDMIRYGTGPLADDYNSRGTTTLPVMGISSLQYFIRNLAKARPLPVEEHILLVHNTDSDDISITEALEAFKNSFWVLCPLSNIFIHRCLPNISLLKKYNLNICIGTDSLSSNHNLNMVNEMKSLQDNFAEVTSFEEILTWATLNGAKALGKESTLGSLEVGKKPGIVLLENFNFTDNCLTDNSLSKRLI